MATLVLVVFRLPEMPLNVSRECESLNELADARGETVIFWAVDTVANIKTVRKSSVRRCKCISRLNRFWKMGRNEYG